MYAANMGKIHPLFFYRVGEPFAFSRIRSLLVEPKRHMCWSSAPFLLVLRT